jgi:hypothetical protein
MRMNPNGSALMVASCHPERRHYAKNKCASCWRKTYYGTPDRKAKRYAWYSSEYRKNRSFYAERVKMYHVWKAYGIDLGEYFAILSAGCQICRGTASVIDHSHVTGKVRGGLCKQCNTGLGMFRDSPKLLNKAGVYLGL